MKYELIDYDDIQDADLYSARNELEARLAAMLAGDPIDPMQLAKDQSVMITNMLTLVRSLSGSLNEIFQAFDNFDQVHSELKGKFSEIKNGS